MHTCMSRRTDSSTTTKDNGGLHYHEKGILRRACRPVFPLRLLQLRPWSLWLTHHLLCQTLWAQSFGAPPPVCLYICVYVVHLSPAARESNLSTFVFQIVKCAVFVNPAPSWALACSRWGDQSTYSYIYRISSLRHSDSSRQTRVALVHRTTASKLQVESKNVIDW